uniref:Uncharacterized protein n=1 Tax=Steinernema glaseri TaxID=37863 RepID=A0A1I7YA44_9BILA
MNTSKTLKFQCRVDHNKVVALYTISGHLLSQCFLGVHGISVIRMSARAAVDGLRPFRPAPFALFSLKDWTLRSGSAQASVFSHRVGLSVLETRDQMQTSPKHERLDETVVMTRNPRGRSCKQVALRNSCKSPTLKMFGAQNDDA